MQGMLMSLMMHLLLLVLFSTMMHLRLLMLVLAHTSNTLCECNK